jgi:hypothetical protein
MNTLANGGAFVAERSMVENLGSFVWSTWNDPLPPKTVVVIHNLPIKKIEGNITGKKMCLKGC